MRRRIRNAYTKSVGKEWYKKMIAAKQAKADKLKREKTDPLDLHQPAKPRLPDTVQDKPRIEVTKPTYSSKMDENTSPANALDKAINRLREQAKGL